MGFSFNPVRSVSLDSAVTRTAVTSSAASRGVKSAALCCVVALLELSVGAAAGASSSLSGPPDPRSPGLDLERGG